MLVLLYPYCWHHTYCVQHRLYVQFVSNAHAHRVFLPTALTHNALLQQVAHPSCAHTPLSCLVDLVEITCSNPMHSLFLSQ
jgi:hypothetical protein